LAGRRVPVVAELEDGHALFEWLPALNALKVGNPFLAIMDSAMMDRAELPVHKNKTL
jgi:hypothetical protein